MEKTFLLYLSVHWGDLIEQIKKSVIYTLSTMEVDIVADYSIISKRTYAQKFSNFPLCPSKVELKTYMGETRTVCGEMKCDVVSVQGKRIYTANYCP